MFGAILFRLVQVLALAYNFVRAAVQNYGWRRVLLTAGAIIFFFWMRPFLPQIGQWIDGILRGGFRRGENGARFVGPRIWNGLTASVRALFRGIWQVIRSIGLSIRWTVFRGLDFYTFWIVVYAVLGVGLTILPGLWGIFTLVSLPFILTLAIPCILLGIFIAVIRWWLISIGVGLLVLAFALPWALAHLNPFAWFDLWVRVAALFFLLIIARRITQAQALRHLYGSVAAAVLIGFAGYFVYNHLGDVIPDSVKHYAKAEKTLIDAKINTGAVKKEVVAKQTKNLAIRLPIQISGFTVPEPHKLVMNPPNRMIQLIMDGEEPAIDVFTDEFGDKHNVPIAYFSNPKTGSFLGQPKVFIDEMWVSEVQSQVNALRAEIKDRAEAVPPPPPPPPAPPTTPVVDTSVSANCAAISGPPEYVALVDKYLSVYQMGNQRNLVLALITVESGWNPTRVSRRGAMGLMQLMPDTARDLGVTDPYDPEQNIRGGIQYLAQQLRDFSGTELALAAYNAGPKFVPDRPGKSWAEMLAEAPPETLEYVPKIIASARCQSPAVLMTDATPRSRPHPAGMQEESVHLEMASGPADLFWISPEGQEVQLRSPSGQWCFPIRSGYDVFVFKRNGKPFRTLAYPKGGETYTI